MTKRNAASRAQAETDVDGHKEELIIPSMGDISTEGYEEVNPNFDGWAVKAKDTWVIGTVVGLSKSVNDEGKDRTNILVKLTAPCTVIRPNAKGETDEGEAGEIIALDMSKSIEPCEEFAKTPGCYHIKVHYIDKKKIRGGRSFWETKLYKKQIKALPTDFADRF